MEPVELRYLYKAITFIRDLKSTCLTERNLTMLDCPHCKAIDYVEEPYSKGLLRFIDKVLNDRLKQEKEKS